MTHPADPSDLTAPEGPDASPVAEPSLRVAVERTGGVAGMTRRWSVTPGAEQEGRWLVLIDECPWNRAAAAPQPAEPHGADRFCWTVVAARGADERRAALAEHEVYGPWRTLIDAVRDASR